MKEIAAWLNGRRDYEHGIRIFLKYSDDPVLAALFTLEQESDFKRRRLVQAMQDLVKPSVPAKSLAPPKTAPQWPVIAPAAVPPTQAHSHWPNPIADPVIQALWNQWRPLYAELISLQQRIYEVALQAENGDSNKQLEACQMAHRIMDLDDELDRIYADRDYCMRHGHLPHSEQPKDQVGDPVRMATELQNFQRYVRNYRLKIKKQPDNKLVPQWEQKIKDWEDSIARYKKLLKLDE